MLNALDIDPETIEQIRNAIMTFKNCRSWLDTIGLVHESEVMETELHMAVIHASFMQTTLATCVIGILTYFGGRHSKTKQDGREWGEFTAGIKTDISYIKRDVSGIKHAFNEDAKELRASMRRIHVRIDDYEKPLHGSVVTFAENSE